MPDMGLVVGAVRRVLEPSKPSEDRRRFKSSKSLISLSNMPRAPAPLTVYLVRGCEDTASLRLTRGTQQRHLMFW